jgi:quercetin dioxygenase-like cupin family protein
MATRIEGEVMSPTAKSLPAAPGKLVIFEAADAPTLDETGMMSAPSFSDPNAREALAGNDFMRRSSAAARLTVPFRQQGANGFSVVTVEFGPGYWLPRHSHSSDCLYYIVAGELEMGARVLGPGDGFFLPAGQPYAYRAGAQGVTVLEFRHSTDFDIQITESDMARFRDKALASLDAAGAK